MISTLAELRDMVREMVRRPDLTSAQIDNLIALAEARINDTLFVREREADATFTTAANVTTITLPADFYRVRSLKVTHGGQQREIDSVSLAKVDTVEVGAPQGYTVGASSIRLSPCPDGAYDIALVYWTLIPSLTDAAPTNWLLTRAPNVYLFATCAEAEGYTMNDARVPYWNARLEEAVKLRERSEWNAGAAQRARTASMVV